MKKEGDRCPYLSRKVVGVCSAVTWALIGLVCSQSLAGRGQIYGSVVYPLILGALISTTVPMWIDNRLLRSVGIGMLSGWVLSALALMISGLLQSGVSEFAKIQPQSLLVYFFGLPLFVGVPIGAIVGLATCMALRADSDSGNA